MPRTALVGIVALLLAAAGLGAGRQEREDDLRSPRLRVEWQEFKPLYDAKTVAVIDVRDRASFQAGRIPGARSVPLEEVEKRATELRRLKQPLIIYCA